MRDKIEKVLSDYLTDAQPRWSIPKHRRVVDDLAGQIVAALPSLLTDGEATMLKTCVDVANPESGEEYCPEHAEMLLAAVDRVTGERIAAASTDVAVDVQNCARCGETHERVVFRPLARPMAPSDLTDVVWSYWAPCPTNGEPIMRAVVRTDKEKS